MTTKRMNLKNVLLHDPETNRAEWKKLRKGKIGASQVAEILGFSSRRSPLEAWLKITGREPEDEQEEGQRLLAGRYLESGIARWWADVSNATLCPTPGLLFDPERPWLIGTPDFLAFDRDGNPLVLEVKNVDRMFKDNWIGNPPNEYFTQIQIYEHLCLLPMGEFAVCFGGNELVPRVAYRDDAFLDQTLTFLDHWHEKHIINDVEPEMAPTDECMRVWRRLHPKDNGQIVQLGRMFIAHKERLEAVNQQLKELELEKAKINAEVMNAMGDATYGALPDGSGWSFKTSTINEAAREARVREQRTLRQVKKIGAV